MAHRALNALAEGYGEPKDRVQLEKDIDEAAKVMKGKESLEQLLASKPTVEQMKPYLGVWKGTNGREGDDGETATLTLEVKNGQCV